MKKAEAEAPTLFAVPAMPCLTRPSLSVPRLASPSLKVVSWLTIQL